MNEEKKRKEITARQAWQEDCERDASSKAGHEESSRASSWRGPLAASSASRASPAPLPSAAASLPAAASSRPPPGAPSKNGPTWRALPARVHAHASWAAQAQTSWACPVSGIDLACSSPPSLSRGLLAARPLQMTLLRPLPSSSLVSWVLFLLDRSSVFFILLSLFCCGIFLSRRRRIMHTVAHAPERCFHLSAKSLADHLAFFRPSTIFFNFLR